MHCNTLIIYSSPRTTREILLLSLSLSLSLVCVCAGAPESEEDVVQIQSASCEDILTLFPNGHQGVGVVVKTPARRRSLSLSL